VEGVSSVHRCDARAKIVMLLLFSIGIFAVQMWWALGLFAFAAVAFVVAARIPLGLINRFLAPIYLLAGFSVLFNVVSSPGIEGLSTGLFVAVRMIVLVVGSFIVCLTTTSSQLLDAFRSFIAPLRRFRVPVDDIAFTLALSVRFIPVIQQEFGRIRAAQIARGGESTGSAVRDFKIWGSAFASLFVGLFRHADQLSAAMDARCYGAAASRTRLPNERGTEVCSFSGHTRRHGNSSPRK